MRKTHVEALRLAPRTRDDVAAHTLPSGIASQRVLLKAGFHKSGELVDPEDGLVWRYEVDRSDVAVT